MKTFPPEFTSIWRQSGIVAAFVSDIVSERPSDCDNCGGTGLCSTFVAFKGPFNNPSSKQGEVSHFHEKKWWIGNTYTARCPRCNGNGTLEHRD